jgi:hypothetical protein
MGRAMMITVEERLRWFQIFMPLYEKAAPLVRRIANIEMLGAGELPVSPYTLVESNLTLRPILQALKKIPEPKEKDLVSIQTELETALSSCIKAAEAAAKYIDLQGRGIADQVLLGIIINSTVLAHEYIESVSKRLEMPRMSNLEARLKLGLVPDEEYLKEKETLNKKQKEILNEKDVTPPPVRVQSAIDKAANGIERGLDKLGDAIVFPLEKMAQVFSARKRRPKQRGHK